MNAEDAGALDPYPDHSSCELVGGDPCPITPNEIKQVLASGSLDGVSQADDIDFAGSPAGSANEPSCSPTPLPGCTSPYGAGDALRSQVNANRPVIDPPVPSTSYPARKGFDQFYGYGRANMDHAVRAVVDDPADPDPTELPPEADITSPQWFAEIDPGEAAVDVEGEVFARGDPYSCRLLVAPGQYPNNALTTDPDPGDFEPVDSGYCDGSTHSGAAASSAHEGVLGSIDVAELRSRFPVGTNFAGAIPTASAATGNGRPFFAPQAFTFKVVVSTTTGTPRTGEDQRTAWLHHDQDLLNGFPKAIREGGEVGGPASAPTADGASSPAFADLDGDNRNELVFADSDGFVHALDVDGNELPGWPVRGDVPGFVDSHSASPAYAGGAVSDDLGGAFLSAVAIGDADGDGIPEVYAADFEGKVYGWAAGRHPGLRGGIEPRLLRQAAAPVRERPQRRGQSHPARLLRRPVLADLDGDGRQEVIAASMDRHVYAWNGADSNPDAPGGAGRSTASRSSSSIPPRSPRSIPRPMRSPTPPARTP